MLGFVFLVNKYFAFWSTQLLRMIIIWALLIIMADVSIAFFQPILYSLSNYLLIYFHGIFSQENQVHDTLNHCVLVSMFIFNPVVARDKPAREIYFLT